MTIEKLLPFGVKDFYPSEVEKLKTLLGEIEKQLSLWGYREIKLPYIEYKELFSKTLKEDLEDGFIFPERETGKLLALRWDFTPQLVRFVLHTRNKINYPLRVYYKGETFKSNRQLWEDYSVGFELLGAHSVEADAEIIATIKTIFDKFSIKDYHIVIGHRQAYESLKKRIPENLLKEKTFLKNLPWETYTKLYPLKDFKQIKDLPEVVKQDLEKLYEWLKTYDLNTENIFFYPAEVPPREYYSGLFFSFVHKRGILARGGRYDKLFKEFGLNIPATGGAIKILNLLEVLDIKATQRRKVYIIDTTAEKRAGWELAKYFRQKGIICERDIVPRKVEESIKAATNKGYNEIIVISEKGNFKTDTEQGNIKVIKPTEVEKIKKN